MPGDIITTGTPPGVGMGMKPNPIFLKDEDVMTLHVEGLGQQTQKVKFINTCNAMLHARSLGESFGLSCAEFAIKNKPIFTYGFCRQRAHFEICKN